MSWREGATATSQDSKASLRRPHRNQYLGKEKLWSREKVTKDIAPGQAEMPGKEKAWEETLYCASILRI